MKLMTVRYRYVFFSMTTMKCTFPSSSCRHLRIVVVMFIQLSTTWTCQIRTWYLYKGKLCDCFVSRKKKSNHRNIRIFQINNNPPIFPGSTRQQPTHIRTILESNDLYIRQLRNIIVTLSMSSTTTTTAAGSNASTTTTTPPVVVTKPYDSSTCTPKNPLGMFFFSYVFYPLLFFWLLCFVFWPISFFRFCGTSFCDATFFLTLSFFHYAGASHHATGVRWYRH
jgi:hypothetical protein